MYSLQFFGAFRHIATVVIMKLHIAVLVAAVANKAFAIPRQAVITPVRETMLEAGMSVIEPSDHSLTVCSR